MKKKIISILTVNHFLVLVLWALSVMLTIHLLYIFGWKINRPYNKKREKKYRKRLDVMCHVIVCVWCLMALINLYYYGPFYTVFYFAQNLVYFVLTFLTIQIWLKRQYHTDKCCRNFLVIVGVWNTLIYFAIAVSWVSAYQKKK